MFARIRTRTSDEDDDIYNNFMDGSVNVKFFLT